MSSRAGKGMNIVAKKNKKGSIRSIFMHADAVDKWLMTLGLLGAVTDGFCTRMIVVLASHLMNRMGRAGASDVHARVLHVNKVPLFYPSVTHRHSNTNTLIRLGFDDCRVDYWLSSTWLVCHGRLVS